VPHPLVTETMDLFKDESAAVKSKLVFIHFNHTNPLIRLPELKNKVKQSGFNVAEQGNKY
jgi:pyrroloquinoline quinone biosynthesis protein B